MRVGIDITPVIYQGTGIGTYTRELVRHLLPHAKKSHFVLFASTLRGQKKLWSYLKTLSEFSNFSIKVFPFPPLFTEVAWNKLHRISVEKLVGTVDVFHAWDWQQPPAKSAKLVTTIHDLTTLKFPQEHHHKTVAVHKKRLEWVAKEADAIITDSDATKQDVEDLLQIKREKLHAVHLAAREQFNEFRNQESGIRNQEINKVKQKFNIRGDYVLSVGTREPRKNLNRVVKAFNTLSEPNLTLVIAGKYGWGKELNARHYKLKAKVKILGYVEQQNLPALYAGSKVFVYPSLYEGFGLPVLESMSIGTPVVTSDRGSLKEVAGDAAIIVDPENSTEITAGIETALGDKSNSLIRLGLKQAKKFSWENTARQTLAIYKYVLH